jgi:hypothetical protein
VTKKECQLKEWKRQQQLQQLRYEHTQTQQEIAATRQRLHVTSLDIEKLREMKKKAESLISERNATQAIVDAAREERVKLHQTATELGSVLKGTIQQGDALACCLLTASNEANELEKKDDVLRKKNDERTARLQSEFAQITQQKVEILEYLNQASIEPTELILLKDERRDLESLQSKLKKIQHEMTAQQKSVAELESQLSDNHEATESKLKLLQEKRDETLSMNTDLEKKCTILAQQSLEQRSKKRAALERRLQVLQYGKELITSTQEKELKYQKKLESLKSV